MHLCLVQSTVCMSLLQPQRETYNLFDDVLLLADGASSSQCIARTYPADMSRVYLHSCRGTEACDGESCLSHVKHMRQEF